MFYLREITVYVQEIIAVRNSLFETHIYSVIAKQIQISYLTALGFTFCIHKMTQIMASA